MLARPHRSLRPGFSETFPYPMRLSPASGLAYFDVGHGPVLLLVHGLGGNFTHWEHVAPSLARTHRVIGIDLPGCGDSQRMDRPSIDGFAAKCVRLLDELGVAGATWVGHSLGAMVVAAAALQHPERVDALVIVDGAGFHRYPAPLRALAPHLPPKLVSVAIERLAFRLLGQVFSERNLHTEKFIAQAKDRPAHPTVDEFAAFLCPLAREVTTRHFLDELDHIVQPVLVIWGDQDRLIPFPPVARWVSRLPSAKLVRLRGCGHMPIIERPAAVVAALASFSTEISSQQASRRRATS